MFKDTKEGQTNYCERCEDLARGKTPLSNKHTCKTNTLDKCKCACHDKGFRKIEGVNHSARCCENMNGMVEEDYKVKPEGFQEKAKWEHKIRTMFTKDEVDGMLKGEREVYGLEGYEKGRKEVLEAVLARMEGCATAKECRHIVKEYLL